MSRRPVSAVFFDVDFTLIYPGPTFQGEGYAAFCERYGMTVDPARFPQAVRAASSILDAAQDHAYDADIFVCYTRRIIEEMGGSGPRLDECATRDLRRVGGLPALLPLRRCGSRCCGSWRDGA